MKIEKTKTTGYHSVIDISIITGVTINVIYKAIYALELTPCITIKKKNYYSDLKLYKINSLLTKQNKIIKYYPLKTIEQFYIYESKLNNQ